MNKRTAFLMIFIPGVYVSFSEIDVSYFKIRLILMLFPIACGVIMFMLFFPYKLSAIVGILKEMKALRLFFLYLIFGLLSTLWSQDYTSSFYYSLVSIAVAFCALISISMVSTRIEIYQLLFYSLSLMVFLQVAMVFMTYDSQYGFIHNFHGVAAIESLIGVIVYHVYSTSMGKKGLPWVYFLFMSALLLSTSYKTILGGTAGLIAANLFLKSTGFKSHLKKFVIFILFIVTSVILLFYIINTDEDSLGKVYHLNGRVAIWAFLANKFVTADLLHKIIGFGFAAGDEFTLGGMVFQNGHNVVISSLVCLGFVGAILQIAILKNLCAMAWKFRKSDGWMIASVLAVIIIGMANQGLAGPLSGPWWATIVIIIMFELKYVRSVDNRYKREKFSYDSARW